MTLMPALRLECVKSIFQAAALLMIGLAVIGALWNREVCTAQASAVSDRRQREDPFLKVRGKHVTRSNFKAMDLVDPFENAPLLGDSERVKALLPAGSTYDVLVKGGFVAQKSDPLHGGPLRNHMAYAFEMSYRREIESNDGRQIVERRSFGSVRMAKILSAADDMQLDLGSPDQPVFEGVSFQK